MAFANLSHSHSSPTVQRGRIVSLSKNRFWDQSTTLQYPPPPIPPKQVFVTVDRDRERFRHNVFQQRHSNIMNLPSSEQPSVPSVLADGVVHFVRIFISSCSGGTFGINHGGGGNDGGGRMLLSVADQVLDDIDEEEWFHDYVVTANDPGPVLFVSATLLCVFLYAAAFAAAATTCGERLSGGKAKKLPRQPSAPLGGGGGGGDEKKEDAPDDNGGDGGEGGGRWAAAAAAHPFVAEDDGQHQRQALLQHPMFVGTNDGDDDDPGQPTHHQQGNKKWGRRNSMGKFMRRLPPQPTRHQRRSSISGPTVPSHPAAASVVVQHDHEHWFLNPTASTFAAAAGYGSLTVPSPRRGSMTSPRRGSMTSTAASSCAAGPPDGDVLGDPALAVFSDANNNNTGGTAASPSLRTALLKAKAVTDCCDGTTRDILRLAGPFVVQALLVGGSEVIRVALVGHLLGTAALSAYVIVDMLVRLTGDCVESILAAGSTLIAQLVEEDDDDDDSDDDDNGDDDGTAGDGGSETSSGRKTADQQRRSGQYLQLSLLLYIVAYLPTVVLWSACMGRVLVFLGYTPSVAEEGRQFAIPYTLATLARGSGSAFQLMLDVVGYEVQSTVLTGVAEVGTTAVLGLVLWWREDMTLLGLGCLHLAADIACLVGLCAMIHHRGWLKDYYSGLFFSTGGCTLFTPAAVQLVLTNSAALALTHLVYHCEWQILTFFARYVIVTCV